MELKGKKILFFSASFFGYSAEICSAMKYLGASVDYHDERPANTFFVKAMIRMYPKLLNKYIQKYYDSIIEASINTKYDYIFFIKAEAVTTESLEKLKKTQPQAKMVLYLYDSIENIPNAMRKLPYFDRVLSFDRNDCKKYGIIFRPLFYTTDYRAVRNSQSEKEFDVLFIGTIHSDRYRFLRKIENIVTGQGRKIYFYLFFMSTALYYKMKLTDKAVWNTPKSDFKFQPLNQAEIIQLLRKTKSVIDIQHPKQTGLTMRTIEALGAGIKLITTNADIVNYDFYNSNNIIVVDRQLPVIPAEFLENKYIDIPEAVYEKYSINNWLSDILA